MFDMDHQNTSKSYISLIWIIYIYLRQTFVWHELFEYIWTRYLLSIGYLELYILNICFTWIIWMHLYQIFACYGLLEYIGTRYLFDNGYLKVFVQDSCLTSGSFNIFVTDVWHELLDIFAPNIYFLEIDELRHLSETKWGVLYDLFEYIFALKYGCK